MNLRLSASPHIRAPFTTQKIMFMVLLALMPALLGSIYFFGMRALWLSLIGVASAVATEAVVQKLLGREITVWDGSAAITGLLVAFNIPPCSPLWLPAAGSIFAIVVAKQLFGGLGYNFINPALAGRAFLMASWPSIMTNFRGILELPDAHIPALSGVPAMDAVTQATPLTAVKMYPDSAHLLMSKDGLLPLFFGNVGGVVGETSALLLLIGGIFLIITRVIDWRIPVGYIGTVFVFSGLLSLFGVIPTGPLFHILAGGLMLGAFFMATDYVTTPITLKGRWIFAIGCGILTVLIRVWGGYPEGVSYSILLMNVFSPLIEKYTMPKPFGLKILSTLKARASSVD